MIKHFGVKQVLFIAVFVFALARVGHTSPIMDQEYDPGTDNSVAAIGSNNVVDWSQTFTVGISGTLTSVELAMIRNASVTFTKPLLFDIRTTSGGTPTEPDTGFNILASKSIAPPDVPTTYGFFSISGLGVCVTAGDILAITLRSDDPHAYHWAGTGQTLGYTGGSAFVRAPVVWEIQPPDGIIHDLGFRTFVESGPAPRDRDGDAIPDCRDECPKQSGIPEYGGCPPPPVDLVVAEVTFSAWPKWPAWTYFPAARVQNLGPEKVGHFDVNFETFAFASLMHSKRVRVKSLEPGQWVWVYPYPTKEVRMDRYRWLIELRPGDYTLRVECDPHDRIEESDETNNVAEIPVILGPIF